MSSLRLLLLGGNCQKAYSEGHSDESSSEYGSHVHTSKRVLSALTAASTSWRATSAALASGKAARLCFSPSARSTASDSTSATEASRLLLPLRTLLAAESTRPNRNDRKSDTAVKTCNQSMASSLSCHAQNLQATEDNARLSCSRQSKSSGKTWFVLLPWQK